MKKFIATIILAAATVACVPGTSSTDVGCKAVRDAIDAGERPDYDGRGFWVLNDLIVLSPKEDSCWN